MLGNQFFLARKYSQAAENLEIALSKNHKNKAIQRKLIICYTQIGQIEKAFENFQNLIAKDIDYIIKTDPRDNDCPCSELVFKMEKMLSTNQSSLDYHLILGMLYLYCNVQKSRQYFQSACTLDPKDIRIHSILKRLNEYEKTNH